MMEPFAWVMPHSRYPFMVVLLRSVNAFTTDTRNIRFPDEANPTLSSPAVETWKFGVLLRLSLSSRNRASELEDVG